MASDSEELFERSFRGVTDRLSKQSLVHDETLALLARSRLWSARDDLVEVLAARRDQLMATPTDGGKEQSK